MRDIFISIISVLIACAFAWAGSYGGPSFAEFPALMLIAGTGFIIHWIIFLPSFFFITEKFYDITGTIAYFVMVGLAVYIASESRSLSILSKIIAVMVLVWALRLGLFLLIRVFRVGEDKRFSEAKKSFFKFLMFFSLSALWVFLTTANALTLILNNPDINGVIFLGIGGIIWIIGFLFEVIADEQKRQFRRKDSNHGHFITTGLWSMSRHPNYFGEILIWIGMAVISFPVLSGWQYATLISPLFVILMLTRVSGINLLEKSADKKWGNLDEYQTYKSTTATLIPFNKSKNKN
jgi:steroid 5-alpha reductase family enzyme|tara:strand:- start:1488 stop:2366 length:879 start_codon:yes stop_codon:yes gene_type:complete